MTEKEECVITVLADRVCIEVSMAAEMKGNTNKAMDHLATAQKALDALRYKLFQSTHISGTVK